MTKIYKTKIQEKMSTGSGQGKFQKQKFASFGRMLSYLRPISLSILKFIYLLVGLTGLVGTITMTFKVIHLPSISNFNMVLIFVIACFSLEVMRAGFIGFYELLRDKK